MNEGTTGLSERTVSVTSSREVGLDYAEPDTSEVALRYERRRQALINLVIRFLRDGLSFDGGAGYKATYRSAEAACAFIICLPSNYQLPQIAVDDDGDIIMFWSGEKSKTALTIASWRLHAVVNPGEATSIHLPVLVFDGQSVPKVLLERIPVR